MTNVIKKLWKNYKHRFVPWVTFQIKNNKNGNTPGGVISPISIHHITKKDNNYFLNEEQLQIVLTKLFRAFASESTAMADEERQNVVRKNQGIMIKELGFTVTRRESTLGPNVGSGVFVTGGNVKAGTVVGKQSYYFLKIRFLNFLCSQSVHVFVCSIIPRNDLLAFRALIAGINEKPIHFSM